MLLQGAIEEQDANDSSAVPQTCPVLLRDRPRFLQSHDKVARAAKIPPLSAEDVIRAFGPGFK